MNKGDYLSVILRSKKTVLSLKDLALLWHESNTTATRVRLHYYIEKGDLYRIRGGLYAKDRNYSKLELATRVLTPAYVSFETVLAKVFFNLKNGPTLTSKMHPPMEIVPKN